MPLDTDSLSTKYRFKITDITNKRLLISRIGGSGQEQDLTEPVNVQGLGRIRHFHRRTSSRWIDNPLPIDPACDRLNRPISSVVTAQVFQNAACNWRCWYCYVPFDLLSASEEKSEWAHANWLVQEYLKLPDRPPILDLSGGQPELTPEWVVWTMQALGEAGRSSDVYLWSDDNLSNDYFWRYLSPKQRSFVAGYRNYGKVGCFKGFDRQSFAFNTEASEELFDRQFELFKKYIREGIDIYAYATITHPGRDRLRDAIKLFVDRLQAVDPMLPLRTVPLEITVFGPVRPRLDAVRRYATDKGQYEALDEWHREMHLRFSSEERAIPIHQIKWKNK